MRHKIIHDPIYDITIHFWRTSLKTMQKFIVKDSGQPVEIDDGWGRFIAYTSKKSKATAHIWVNPELKLTSPDGISTLVHECLHAALFNLGNRNVELNPKDGNHEAFTYYLGWLVKEGMRLR